jgi:hypothetical protein
MRWKEIANKRKKCGSEANMKKKGGKRTYSRKLMETDNRFAVLETCSDQNKDPCEAYKSRQKRGHRKRVTQKPRCLWSTTITNPAYEAQENIINVTLDSDIKQIPVVTNGQTSTLTTTSNHNILIIGDSHARGVAGKVQYNLTPTSSTSGFASSGAPVRNIISAMTSTIQHLRKNDVLVLWGGANNIYQNNIRDALKCIASFVEEVNNTNIIILSIPLRRDLPMWSMC